MASSNKNYYVMMIIIISGPRGAMVAGPETRSLRLVVFTVVLHRDF